MADERKRRQLACLRCGTPMVFLRREDIQLGRYTYFGGDMGNLLAGSLPVTMSAAGARSVRERRARARHPLLRARHGGGDQMPPLREAAPGGR